MSKRLLPGNELLPTTSSVAFFRENVDSFANWLKIGLTEGGHHCMQSRLTIDEPENAFAHLVPPADIGVTSYLLISLPANWTAMLNNARFGTDVGMIPSLAARNIGCMAIRATAIPDSQDRFGAMILEVYEPEAAPPLRCRRVISAANDGGTWRFDQFGNPFTFENASAYKRRRIRDRFTCEMLHDYLDLLGVPEFTMNSLRDDVMLLLEMNEKANKVHEDTSRKLTDPQQ